MAMLAAAVDMIDKMAAAIYSEDKKTAPDNLWREGAEIQQHYRALARAAFLQILP